MSMKTMKYRIIWIDDQRNPSYPINWKSAIPKEFADMVENEYPQIIWLKSLKSFPNFSIRASSSLICLLYVIILDIFHMFQKLIKYYLVLMDYLNDIHNKVIVYHLIKYH